MDDKSGGDRGGGKAGGLSGGYLIKRKSAGDDRHAMTAVPSSTRFRLSNCGGMSTQAPSRARRGDAVERGGRIAAIAERAIRRIPLFACRFA